MASKIAKLFRGTSRRLADSKQEQDAGEMDDLDMYVGSLKVIEVAVNDGADGLSLDIIGAGLLIVSIEGGAVQEYNDSNVVDDRMVHVNDIITNVSGESNPFLMLEIMQNSKEYTLHITQPFRTKVSVKKVSGNLGLNLKYNPGSTCMEIARVLAGDIKDYNVLAAPNKQVHAGSLIVAVNGQSNSVLRMRQLLKDKALLQLTLLYVGTLRNVSV